MTGVVIVAVTAIIAPFAAYAFGAWWYRGGRRR